MNNQHILRQDEQQKPTLKEKAAKGFFWGGLSNFFQQLIGMCFGIAMGRILSPDDYGLVTMLYIFPALASSFIDSGFSSALMNRKTIEHRDYNAVFWFGTLMGFGLYIVLFFLAPLIARFYNQPVLTNLSRILFLNFLFNAMGMAHHVLLYKKMMAKQWGLIGMASVLFSGVFGVVLALNGYAYWCIALHQVAQSLITMILRWYYSKWKPSWKLDFSPIKEMFGYSIKLLVTGMAAQITNHIFSVFFGKLYGESVTGYYAQGNKWASYGSQVVAGMLGGVAYPALVEAKTDVERQVRIFRKMLRFGAFITFPAMLGLALTGKEFILITLGEKWVNSVIFLQLFCLFGINTWLSSLYTTLIWSHEKSTIYMRVSITLLISQLMALFVIHFFHGSILLMLCAYIVLYCLSTLWFHYFANRIIGLKTKDVMKDLFPYVLTACISVTVAWGTTFAIENIYIKFVVKCMVMAVVYALTLWYGNSVIAKESFLYLKGMIKK